MIVDGIVVLMGRREALNADSLVDNSFGMHDHIGLGAPAKSPGDVPAEFHNGTLAVSDAQARAKSFDNYPISATSAR